ASTSNSYGAQRLLELLLGDLARRVDDDPSLGVQIVGLGQPGQPVAAFGRGTPVADRDEVDLVLAEEAAGVAREVVDIDSEERDLPSVRASGGAKARRLGGARRAPGRPEVEHDRLTPQLAKRHLSVFERGARGLRPGLCPPPQDRQREIRRERLLAGAYLTH